MPAEVNDTPNDTPNDAHHPAIDPLLGPSLGMDKRRPVAPAYQTELPANVGTIGLVARFRLHWQTESHPLYRFQVIPLDQLLNVAPLVRWVKRNRLWFVVGILAVLTWLVLQIVFRAQWGWFLAMVCGAGTALPILAIFGVIYCLPVVVAVVSSGLVIAERERQTWDILLSLPMEWGDLVLARLARLLKYINPFEPILIVINLGIAGLTFLFVVVRYAAPNAQVGEALLAWIVIFVGPIHFLVERLQDFLLACIIGLIASLIAPSRQVAAVTALFGMGAWLLARGIAIAALITIGAPFRLNNSLMTLISGFSGTIIMTLPVWLSLILLIMTAVAYDLVIRLLFHWVRHHLGTTSQGI